MIKKFVIQCIKRTMLLFGIYFTIIGFISDISASFTFPFFNYFSVYSIIISFLGILFISVIVELVIFIRKENTIYKRGMTSFIFEYRELTDIIETEERSSSDNALIVVPVNTWISKLGDLDIIKDKSVHKVLIKHICDRLSRESLDEKTFLNASMRFFHERNNNDGLPGVFGSVGDWFLLTSKELDNKTSLSYLFIVENDVFIKNNKPDINSPDRIEYLRILQTVFDVIESCDLEYKVYIPLIGTGNSKIGKPKDVMFLMAAMLRFNKGRFRQEIHVFLNEKYKNDTPIYELNKIN